MSRLCIMLALVAAVAAVTACERASSHKRLWWCWADGGLCFPSKDQCTESARTVDIDGPCKSSLYAYCRWGCDNESGQVDCHENCVPTLDMCEEGLGRATEEGCEKKRAYEQPEIFPSYTRPGWWCMQAEGAPGSPLAGVTVSNCEKTRDECENYASSVTPAPPCEQPAGPVICYGVHDAPTAYDGFNCHLTMEHCRATRDVMESMGPDRIEITSECKAWTYN